MTDGELVEMGDKFRVYYCRFNMNTPNQKGHWENLTKDFHNEDGADKFIRRIKNSVIVGRYTKSRIYTTNKLFKLNC